MNGFEPEEGKAWEMLEHTSDLELLIRGKSEKELFVNSTAALVAQIVEREDIRVAEEKRIELSAETLEERFLDWLRELLYLNLTRGFLTKEIKDMTLMQNRERFTLTAIVGGEDIDTDRHQLLHEVKTVTYQDFFYGKRKGIWQARVVFDI